MLRKEIAQLPAFAMDSKAVRAAMLLLLLFIVRGVGLICLLPPGEMWDEYSHLAYIDHWAATGKPAVYGETNVDPAFLAAIALLPQPVSSGIGNSYAAFWAHAPTPALPTSLGLYEAQHQFFYYAMASPIYRLAGGHSNLRGAVAALRLLNLLFGTAGILLILWWLYRSIGRTQATIVGMWIVLQPLLLLNVVRVANDALAFLLGSAVIVIAMELQRDRLWTHVALLASLLPLAALAKATNFTLVPVVVLAFLMTMYRGVHVRSALVAVGVVLCTTASVLAPYLSFDLQHFGLITPMQEAVANRAAGRSLWEILTAIPVMRWPVLSACWWIFNGLWLGGWSFLQPPRVLEIAYAILLATAGAVTILQLRSSEIRWSSRWLIVGLVISVQCGLMIHAAESYSAWSGQVTTNSWYALVAVPWLLILLGNGAFACRSRWIRWGVLLGIPILFIAAEWVGEFKLMVPAYYSATPLTKLSMERMQYLHPAMFGPATWMISNVMMIVLILIVGRNLVRSLPRLQRTPHAHSPNPVFLSSG